MTHNKQYRIISKICCVKGLHNRIQPWPVWLSWLGIVLPSERWLVWFLVRAHAWVAGSCPVWAHIRGNRSMFLSCMDVSLFFPSLPLSLKNKCIYILKRVHTSWEHSGVMILFCMLMGLGHIGIYRRLFKICAFHCMFYIKNQTLVSDTHGVLLRRKCIGDCSLLWNA